MTPRNPEESREKAEQDEILRAVHQAPNEATSTQGEPLQHDAPVLAVQPEGGSKAELDRVELYLQGPTVFTA